MKSRRTIRTYAVLASACMVLGVFAAAPADAKKKKKPKKCAAYQPGEAGTGQAITLVTDAATADKPVEVAVPTSPGLGVSSEEGEGNPDEGATSHAYTNVQVDSKAKEALLNIKVSFTPTWDYDLWLRDSSHTALASSAGFGPATSGSDYAHSEVGSETIVGFPTADCDGFTVDVANAGGPGEEVTVSYWLGE